MGYREGKWIQYNYILNDLNFFIDEWRPHENKYFLVKSLELEGSLFFVFIYIILRKFCTSVDLIERSTGSIEIMTSKSGLGHIRKKKYTS